MTPIIWRHPAPAYADAVPSAKRSTLAALLVEQRELEGRIPDVCASPAETLELGEAVLQFAAREDEAFAAVAPLLDPAALTELTAEHQHLAEDLELLGSLVRSAADAPDVVTLAASLLQRMRHHVHRDGRLLARAAAFASR
jgi:hypothetical protein